MAGFLSGGINSVMQALANLMSPSEAEAKIVAKDAPAQQMVDLLLSGLAQIPDRPSPDTLLGSLTAVNPYWARYQDVAQTAEARPETINVRTFPLGSEVMPAGAEGFHRPTRGEIGIGI